MKTLDVAIRKHVPSVRNAVVALQLMERQLMKATTYEQIRRIIKEATALKALLGNVAEVKAAAEDAILIGNQRIAEELAKVPKAKGGGQVGKNGFPTQGKSIGRGATGIKHSSRHRLAKLRQQTPDVLKATAAKLREQGKDATVTAVVRELTQGDKKQRRARREVELAAKITALPDFKAGVIVADPEWRFEPWSRETGMDRAADNHFPTSLLEVIKSRDVASIAAKDCVLFLWATVPMLPHALAVMAAWEFDYRSSVVWIKQRAGKAHGTGYWFWNEHEICLVGVKGNPPCPAPGEQWRSVIEAPVGKHSEKPECFLEMVEQYFPTLPKIELNCRGKPRPGWEAWGNETVVDEAAA